MSGTDVGYAATSLWRKRVEMRYALKPYQVRPSQYHCPVCGTVTLPYSTFVLFPVPICFCTLSLLSVQYYYYCCLWCCPATLLYLARLLGTNTCRMGVPVLTEKLLLVVNPSYLSGFAPCLPTHALRDVRY
eukprot:518305-Rhodomonas_salina.2